MDPTASARYPLPYLGTYLFPTLVISKSHFTASHGANGVLSNIDLCRTSHPSRAIRTRADESSRLLRQIIAGLYDRFLDRREPSSVVVVFLGLVLRSQENNGCDNVRKHREKMRFCATTNGVERARTIRRQPLRENLPQQLLPAVQDVSRNGTPADNGTRFGRGRVEKPSGEFAAGGTSWYRLVF